MEDKIFWSLMAVVVLGVLMVGSMLAGGNGSDENEED